MTREEAIAYFKKNAIRIKGIIRELENEELKDRFSQSLEATDVAIKALEQEPRKITLVDVKGYCKSRYLTIISNELLYELTRPKIKALEQEPILDKIRAEIESLQNANPSYWHSGDMVERDEVFEIIDKYKAESEEN